MVHLHGREGRILTSNLSIPDSSFCCRSSDDELAELESLSAIF